MLNFCCIFADTNWDGRACSVAANIIHVAHNLQYMQSWQTWLSGYMNKYIFNSQQKIWLLSFFTWKWFVSITMNQSIPNWSNGNFFGLPWSSSTSSTQFEDFIGRLGAGPFPSARNVDRSTVTPFFFLPFFPAKHANIIRTYYCLSISQSWCNIKSMVTTSRAVWLDASMRGKNGNASDIFEIIFASERIVLHQESSLCIKLYLRTW